MILSNEELASAIRFSVDLLGVANPSFHKNMVIEHFHSLLRIQKERASGFIKQGILTDERSNDE